MSKTAAVFLNTASQFAGQFIGTLISLTIFVLLAGHLGVEGYGEYVIVTTYLGFFAVAADWSLYLLVVKALSETDDLAAQRRAYGKLVSFRVFLSITSLIFGILLVQFFPYSPEVKLAISVGSLTYFMTSLTQLINGIFQARLKMYISASLDVFYRLLLLASVGLAVAFGWQLLGIVGGMVVSSIVVVLLGLLVARRYLPYSLSDFRFSFADWKEAFRLSWALGLASFLGVLLFKIDAIILSFYGDAGHVGIYGLALKTLEILAALPGAFMGAIFPILARYVIEKDPRLNQSIDRAYLFLFILASLVTVVIFSLARPIVLFIGGLEFSASVFPLQVLIFSLALSFFNNMFYHLAVIFNRQVPLLWRTSLALVVNIILNLILIPLYSYKAAAVITVVTEALSLLLSGYIVLQVHRFRPFPPRMLSVLAATVVTAIVIKALAIVTIPAPEVFVLLSRLHQGLTIIGIALVAAAVFLLTLRVTRGIRRDEVRAVFQR